MMFIYALKNNKLGYFNPPTYSNMDPDSTKVTLQRTCKEDPKKYQEYHYDECSLYFLGHFDEITGDTKLCEKKFLVDLEPCFQEYKNDIQKDQMTMYSQIAFQVASIISNKGGLPNGN